MLLRCIVVFLLLIIGNLLKSQVHPDSTNFRSPLVIPLILSGNFCELRPNHFHTGIDIKTKGVVGQKVVSIEEGYVSRIFYSHYGYGLAVYVNHPNGYTSLYGHLSKFSPAILKKVRAVQQKKQSETFNVLLDSGEIPLKKGELIGLSGTSGSSYAPHLHFEIRETISENAVNPLKFGFNIKDNIKPDIKGVKVYPLNHKSHVNGNSKPLYIATKKTKKGYALAKPVEANGTVGFGIHTTDRLNGAGNVCGVYSVDLNVNNQKIYGHTMDKMDFSKNRYINNHKDYEEYKFKKRNIHKNYLEGNNKLPIYNGVVNKGIVFMKKDSVYTLNYKVLDAYNNKSNLTFKVKGVEEIKNKPEKKCSYELKHNEGNYFDTTNFTLLMGEGAIYTNHCLHYTYHPDLSNITGYHQLNDKRIPLHQYVDIAISLEKQLDASLTDKLLIVEQNKKGNLIAHGGAFLNGRVHTKVRSYGKYALRLDTVKPVIRLVTKQKTLNKLKQTSVIRFKIADNLSGIKSYKAYLDGKWILSNYNRKRGTLTIRLGEAMPTKGAHKVKVVVEDERGNVNTATSPINIL